MNKNTHHTNRQETNGRQTEIGPEIPAIIFPNPAINVNNGCVSDSIKNENAAVSQVLLAKQKLFKTTRKVVSPQDDNETKSNNLITNDNLCSQQKLSQSNGHNTVSNGKGSLENFPASKCLGSTSPSSKEKEASKGSSRGVNSQNWNSIKNSNGRDGLDQKDYFEFDIFEKCLESDIPTSHHHYQGQTKIHQDNCSTTTTNTLSKSVSSCSPNSSLPYLSGPGNHYHQRMPENYTNNLRISNQSSTSTSSSSGQYSTNNSTDIQIDMYDDEDQGAEVILGLDLQNDYDVITGGANLNLKYNTSRYSYSNNNTADICSTTSTTTTISHSTTTSSASSTLSSYVVDDDPANFGQHTSSSSIWDVWKLCEVETCSNPATKKCKSCKAAFYCSESHQKEHWKKHKTNCIPFRMENGVATRDLPAATVIFSEKPLLVLPVACVENDFSHAVDINCVMLDNFEICTAKKPACLGCMKVVESNQGPRYQCSRCGLPLCSEHCEHEYGHMLECETLRRNNVPAVMGKECLHTLYMDLEIVRTLELEKYHPSVWERVLELSHHERVLKYKQSTRFQIFRSKISTLVPRSIIVSGGNLELISDCHAILSGLCFKPALQSPYKMLVGTQLYFAHDCIPNTFSYIEEQMAGNVHRMRCVVKSAVTIMKGEWISMDFVPTPYLSYPLRLKMLQNMYIDCSCKRCTDPTELGDHSNDIQCSACHSGSVVPEHPQKWKDSVWSCSSCQEEVSYYNVNKIYEFHKNKLSNIPKSRKGLKQLVSFIRDANVSLHKTHELVIMAWCFVETILRPNIEAEGFEFLKQLYECNWSQLRPGDSSLILSSDVIDDFVLLDEYCNIVNEHFDAIRPGLWLDRGIVLFHKFYASFVLASNEYQKHSLPKKEFITRVLRSMKVLQRSLEIFTVYEGYNATPHVSRLTKQALWTQEKVHEFVGTLIKEDYTFATTTTNSFRRLI